MPTFTIFFSISGWRMDQSVRRKWRWNAPTLTDFLLDVNPNFFVLVIFRKLFSSQLSFVFLFNNVFFFFYNIFVLKQIKIFKNYKNHLLAPSRISERMCLLCENMGASEWTGHSKLVNILFPPKRKTQMCRCAFLFISFQVFLCFSGEG